MATAISRPLLQFCRRANLITRLQCEGRGRLDQGPATGSFLALSSSGGASRRRRSTVAYAPPAQTGQSASPEEKRDFLSVFPDIVHDLTQVPSHAEIPDAQKWYSKVLQYNSRDGKLNRGLAVGISFKLLAAPELQTPENLRRAHILGWCIELLQSFFLVADDLIDGSPIRRGRPSWHTKDGVGLSAINDALLLEQGIYKLLNLYFKNEPYYVDMIETFHNVTMKTCLGQSMDLMSCPVGQKPKLDMFTMDYYNSLVKFKTGYYSFYLPVVMAMYMAGMRDTSNVRVAEITDHELHRQAKTILLEMGSFFQVQDDFLDCFGDPEETGKSGRDIAEGKCSWLAVVALQRASRSQRLQMEEHYGVDTEESVQKVRELYEELGLPATYRNYEESTTSLIRTHIQQISRGLNHAVFFKLLEKIYKRSS